MEQFLRDLGLSPARSSSRNPLEQPWALTQEELQRRVRSVGAALGGCPRAGDHPGLLLPIFTAARDETAALTEQIKKVEREIDTRVAGLYGVE